MTRDEAHRLLPGTKVLYEGRVYDFVYMDGYGSAEPANLGLMVIRDIHNVDPTSTFHVAPSRVEVWVEVRGGSKKPPKLMCSGKIFYVDGYDIGWDALYAGELDDAEIASNFIRSRGDSAGFASVWLKDQLSAPVRSVYHFVVCGEREVALGGGPINGATTLARDCSCVGESYADGMVARDWKIDCQECGGTGTVGTGTAEAFSMNVIAALAKAVLSNAYELSAEDRDAVLVLADRLMSEGAKQS